MTIYTDGLIVRRDRNLLDDVVTGQFDAAVAAFEQAWFENPTTAIRRINELNRAELGEVESPAYPAYGIPEIRRAPETPLLSAEEARARVKDSGLDISIDDTGIREGALEILLQRKREERERQVVLEGAPSSTVPLQLLAGFAASAIDPINVASAFVPVVGEARYASMLAKATTTAGRFGVRARVGAVEGAVGAALVEPLVLAASAQDQADYDISDSLLNITFGTVLGGGLHSAGGAISDMRRGTALAELEAVTPSIDVKTPSARQEALRLDDDPITMLRTSLQRGIEADREVLAKAADREAFEELAPSIRAELEEIAAGKLPNVRDLKAELSSVSAKLETLDAEYKPLAKEYQQQGMTRKEAESAAREAIAEERAQLIQRQAEVNEALQGNRQAEIARSEIARLDRGELPEQYRQRVSERAQKIAGGYELKQTARAVAEAAPWQVRESALRAAVAQAVTGRPVDVEAVFELANPNTRAAALERLKQPQQRAIDPDGEAASRSADEALSGPDASDLAGAERLLADELALTDEMAAQAGVDTEPFMREADAFEADANTYAAAYRAAALCQLRT